MGKRAEIRVEREEFLRDPSFWTGLATPQVYVKVLDGEGKVASVFGCSLYSVEDELREYVDKLEFFVKMETGTSIIAYRIAEDLKRILDYKN